MKRRGSVQARRYGGRQGSRGRSGGRLWDQFYRRHCRLPMPLYCHLLSSYLVSRAKSLRS
jgi:hypothetical protein